jgi:hypothetical protein
MNNPAPVPHPGYVNAHPYIEPVSKLFSELGAQDACLQMQELAIVHLEKSAQAMNAQMNDYLKLLYISNNIPRGTYSFDEMREKIYVSFVSLTYTMFEKCIKRCNWFYQQKIPPNTWKTTLQGGVALHPLDQLTYNASREQKQALTAPPEHKLLEYYRRVRIASVHLDDDTKKAAEQAFADLTPTDHQHFLSYAHIYGAPNPPGMLSFQDFKLYTRAIKYYINVVNDVCS